MTLPHPLHAIASHFPVRPAGHRRRLRVGGHGRPCASPRSTTSSKSKLIKIAIPTDFPPYGSVGADMAPRGLDIDTAHYIAEKLGVKVELVPVSTANRIPYLQTKKVDLVISTLGKNPEREKVIDFTVAYSPFFISVFGPKATEVKTPRTWRARPSRVTRGSVDDQELTKVAPAGAEVRRFEDNAGTVSAYVSGQTQLIATSIATAAQHHGAQSANGRRLQVRPEGLPELHRRGQGRGRAAPEGQRDRHAGAQERRDRQARGQVAGQARRGAARVGGALDRSTGSNRAAASQHAPACTSCVWPSRQARRPFTYTASMPALTSVGCA